MKSIAYPLNWSIQEMHIRHFAQWQAYQLCKIFEI